MDEKKFKLRVSVNNVYEVEVEGRDKADAQLEFNSAPFEYIDLSKPIDGSVTIDSTEPAGLPESDQDDRDPGWLPNALGMAPLRPELGGPFIGQLSRVSETVENRDYLGKCLIDLLMRSRKSKVEGLGNAVKCAERLCKLDKWDHDDFHDAHLINKYYRELNPDNPLKPFEGNASA